MQALKKLFAHPQSGTSNQDGPAHGATQPEDKLRTCVGDAKSCPEGGRLHAKIEGRYVTVLRVGGKLYCIDSICFHAGGPLGIGDIEDLNGRKCILCPWHSYKIDIESGDKYYQGMDFKDGKLVGGAWKSNGVQQRVHKVVEEGDKIYVTLSTKLAAEAAADAAGGPLIGCGAAEAAGCAAAPPAAPSGPGAAGAAGGPVPSSVATCMVAVEGKIESDGYAFDAQCGDRVLNSPPSANRTRVHSVGADGRKPSGQVLRGQYKS